MWGKIKNTGDDWMYPKPHMDLRFFSSCLIAIFLHQIRWFRRSEFVSMNMDCL